MGRQKGKKKDDTATTLCKCGHVKCNPVQKYSQRTIRQHMSRQTNTYSVCTCGGEFCDTTKLYTTRRQLLHLKRIAEEAGPKTQCVCGGTECAVDANETYNPWEQRQHRERLRFATMREKAKALRKEHDEMIAEMQGYDSDTVVMEDMQCSGGDDDNYLDNGQAESDEKKADAALDQVVDQVVDQDFVFRQIRAEKIRKMKAAEKRAAKRAGEAAAESDTDSCCEEPEPDPDHSGWPQNEMPEHLEFVSQGQVDPASWEFEPEANDHEGQDSKQEDAEPDEEDQAPGQNKQKKSFDWEAKIGPKLTVLTLVTLLFTWQFCFKVNNKCARAVFQIIKFVITQCYSTDDPKVIPPKFPSFDFARKKFTPEEAAGVQKRHVCPKDEWLYPKGPGTPTDKCPLCDHDRYYKIGSKTMPYKKYFSWSLIEQLKMRAGWSGFEDSLEAIPGTPHADKAPNVVSGHTMSDETRAEIIHHVTLGAFVFVLALSSDGFNPWRGVQYTMWFLAVRILNLKIDRIARTDMLITLGITCGPREPSTLQFYLNDIVKEVVYMQANNVTIPRPVTDPQGKVTTVQVRILAYIIALIGDYPALSKLLNVQGVGTHRERDERGINNLNSFSFNIMRWRIDETI